MRVCTYIPHRIETIHSLIKLAEHSNTELCHEEGGGLRGKTVTSKYHELLCKVHPVQY